MATSKAKKEAKSSLGSFDTSGYENLRSSAKNAYDTAVADAENQWSNLQSRLNANRKASAGEFAKGRGNVTEANYLANRADLNRRAAGGTTASGFNDINNLGNRMELGRQYSDLANTYYNALEGIDRDQREGEQTYNMALRRAGDEYNTGLANIGLAQQGAQNEYNRAVASLAESIQSRWDANANAAAALKSQKEAYDKQYQQTRDNFAAGILNELSKNVNTETLANAIKNLRGYQYTDDEINHYLDLYGIDPNKYTSDYIAKTTNTNNNTKSGAKNTVTGIATNTLSPSTNPAFTLGRLLGWYK